MRKILEFLLMFFVRVVLWFRYRFVVKGLDKLTPEALNKSGGVLFLPNHSSVFVDPTAVVLAVWSKFPIRPMIVEYMYYSPIIYTIMKFMNAIPMPQFSVSSNSLKRKKSEKVIQTVVSDLRHGQNFLIYPAGRVKLTEKEVIGGASAVHQILQEVPEANVVLVRVKGLWGSSFSSYHSGIAPDMFPTVIQGIKFCLKNLLFFTPRREVTIELEPAPADFPYHGSRMELNRYLEKWYNKPDGLVPQTEELPGDSLVLVSYSMWGEKYLPVTKDKTLEDSHINLALVPAETQEKIIRKLAELTKRNPSEITIKQRLAADLGLDSLDVSELSAFLQDNFDVGVVPVSELTSVAKLMGVASKQIVYEGHADEAIANLSKWKKPIKREKLSLPQGKTIPEVFLNNCDRMEKAIACGDMRSGVVSYPQLKMRVVLLAEYIRKLPGEYIGILLPASVAANMLILASQLAGKIPLMVNWTVGARHIESVDKLSNVQVVFSSWAFLDRLDNVDLGVIEDKLFMLEDVRRKIGLTDKLKAFFRSKRSASSILKIFKADKLTEESSAVLLFTSGTENMPKGVPLSHRNILSNLRAIFGVADIYSDDVLFGILPPFHVFGFSISGIFGLLTGLKLASSPDPTNGLTLAKGVEKWGATIIVAAPTFLKFMLKSARPEELKTLRLCVVGAEKASPELFQLMADIGKKSALIEGYGITECSPILTVNVPGTPHCGVGRPLPGIELAIVHPETGEDVPLGEQGMILARGPNIFSGYLNPDVASPFVEHKGKKWYKTGDLGFLNKEGYLTLSGRQKRFIKVGGEMISLASIENALMEEAVKQKWPLQKDGPSLAVCAQEIPGDKPKISLFTSFCLNVDDVNRALKEAGFSNLTRISSIEKISEIPIMGSGKVNYRALEEEYKKRIAVPAEEKRGSSGNC